MESLLNDFENGYEKILNELDQIKNDAAKFNLKDHWTYLEESEALLIALINGNHPLSDAEQGSMEFGGVLYIVNKVIDDSADPLLKWAKIILKAMGMPDSKMTPQDIQQLEKDTINGPGLIAGDGTFYSTVTYGQLDPNWILAFTKYLHYFIFPEQKATFGSTPLTPLNQNNYPEFSQTISIKDTLTIAVFGDWGTGHWDDCQLNQTQNCLSPSELVAAGIKSLNPDISMHLGDVYYAGLDDEETTNFLPTFPKGSLLNFTLNSNHEAYDGSNGYFNVALKDSMFAVQNNTSYFAFTYQDWLIVALDSAYYDESFFVMQGGINQTQIDFVKNLNPTPDQKILLFTHHTALTSDGRGINNVKKENNLFNSIYNAFEEKGPDYWYYGHTHNAMVYNDKSATNLNPIGPNTFTKIRCCGHAAIPFGNGYELCMDDNITPIETIDYYANTPMPNPSPRQTRRVLNGFALLTLSNGSIKEEFYEVENGENGVITKKVFSL